MTTASSSLAPTFSFSLATSSSLIPYFGSSSVWKIPPKPNILAMSANSVPSLLPGWISLPTIPANFFSRMALTLPPLLIAFAITFDFVFANTSVTSNISFTTEAPLSFSSSLIFRRFICLITSYSTILSRISKS